MILLSTALGIFTGTLLGFLGGGGSILAVPILVYVLGMEAKSAIATSLLIVGVASLLAAASHFRHKNVITKIAIVFGAAGGLGSYLGALIGKSIPDNLQLMIFAWAMAAIGIVMLKSSSKQPNDTTPDEIINKTSHINHLPTVLFAGCIAGILTGLLGVGGGFIIVPVLTYFVNLPMRIAIGTSLLIICLNSIVGAISYSNYLNWQTTAITPYILGTLAAALIAGHFAPQISQEKLKAGFAITLIFLSAWMLVKPFLGFH